MPRSTSFFSPLPALFVSLAALTCRQSLCRSGAAAQGARGASAVAASSCRPYVAAQTESRRMPIDCTRIASSLAAAALGIAAFLGTASAAGPAKVDDPSAAIPLAPHRAVYDLKLGQLRGKRALEAVRGRIVYDFAGSM